MKKLIDRMLTTCLLFKLRIIIIKRKEILKREYMIKEITIFKRLVLVPQDVQIF